MGRVMFLAAAAALLTAGTAAFAADPQISSFVDNPDPVAAGANVTYTAGITNSALDAATNVVLSVPVPSGATFVSATAPCALAGGTVTCNLGTVNGSDTDQRSLAFVFRATGPGPSSITATATLTADNDANLANNTQSQTTTVGQGGDLSLTQTGSPDPVVGGANVTYTVTAANAGPNASGPIVVTDNLPAAATFVSASGSGWSCSQASGVVTCNRTGPHAAGAAIPALTIVAKVNASSGTITNVATVAPAASGGTADPDNSNNTASVDTNVLAGADVRIAQKTVTSAVPAIAGTNVTFQIQPRNSGPATAANAVVTDNLPSGWTFVSAGGTNWPCTNAGQAVTCTRASFPTTGVDNITVVATAPNNAAVGPTGTAYTNTATIASDTTDPTPGNNSGSVNITVLPDGADLRISKSKTPNPVAQGGALTSTIRVTNNGPRAATGTLRVVELLSGETFASVAGSGWTCDATAAPTIVCDNTNSGGLAVGASLPNLVLTTTATNAGTLTNNACTGGSVPAGASATASPPAQGDPNPGNDCAGASSSSTTIQPDLAITKTTSTPTGADKIVSTSESSVTYTLVVSNLTSPGTDAATGTVIRDTVPAYIASRTTIDAITAVVSAGSATFSCAIASAQVTCTQTGGQLMPGQTVTVPITVNRPMTDGSFTNTATVSNTVEGDPNASNNSASDTVQIDPIADVQMTAKTATPASIIAGQQSTYVLSYRNNGPSQALNVAIGDQFTFPAGDTGLTVVSIASSKGGSSCTIAAGAVLAPGADHFTCAIGSMANGEAQTVTLVVRPNFQPGNATRSVLNVASVTTTTVENPLGGDNGNNSQSATLTINPASVDLLTNKIDYVDPVPYAGDAFLDYRVNVTNNNGPSYATNVRITETMTPPAGKRIRFVCDTNGPASTVCNSPSLCSVTNVTSAAGTALASFTCDVPAGSAITGLGQRELAVNQTKSIYLHFEAPDTPTPSGDVYNNHAAASANEPDTFPGNDFADEQTTVRQRIDLAVAKTSSLATVTLRQPFTWTVTVTNNGPGNSQQTDLTDTLPAVVTVTGPITFTSTSPAASGTCTLAASTITCPLGMLNNLGVATVTIPSRIDTYPAGGTATNTATVDTDPAKIGGIDPVTVNNTGTNTVNATRSSVGGTVFQDRDRSGSNGGVPQAAASEPRIAGVSLTLTGTDAYGNAVSVSTTTDTNGNYSFANLAPSDATGYTVTQSQPAGYVNSPVSPPTSGGNAPTLGGTYAAGGSAGDSSFAGVVVGGNVAGTNYNFPEVRKPGLSGFVYIDMNLNGVRDAGTDIAIVGATVRLLDATTLAVVATTTTDNTGAYSFANLDPLRTYTLEEPLPAAPAGLKNGAVNPGLVGGTACASGCTAQPNTPVADTDRIAAIDLSAGNDGTAFNFGEQQQTTIGGLVFVDANRNNALDASDTGRLAGTTVRLVQGADCSSGTTLQTTVTAANGTYAFANVLAFQTYLVCETQPAGYGTGSANGTPNSNTITVANLPSAGSAGNNFGETLSQITGSVYQDYSPATPANDNNGLRDTGETGIANVPVSLTGHDITGATVGLTTTTDASGNYSFDGLLQSDTTGYTIAEGSIPPASGIYIDGKDTAGTLGGSNAVSDRLGPVVVPAGTVATGYLFGELPIAPISGTVYLDRNRNGTIDATPTDGRIANVTVTLVQGASCAGGTVLQTTTTAADGSYGFSGAAAGQNYLVCETQPAGYAEGSVNPGASATSPAVDTIAITNLPAAGSANNQFGERAGSIAGNVFLDGNDDGLRAGDPGIAGVGVTLSGIDASGAAISRTTTTDATGAWRFDDLLASGAGGYTVTEQAAQPVASGKTTLNGKTTAGSSGGNATPVATTPSAVAAIALAAGATSSENNYAEILPVGVAGTVFIDLNNNGVQNLPGDAGLGSVTLVVTGSDDTGAAVTRTITTAPDGTYTVPDLRPGTYTITEPTQPAGTTNGQTIAGTGRGTATTPATTPSAIAGIVLTTPGASTTGNNFAEIPNTSVVSGRVWLDQDNNGTINGSETGIAGVTITLAGTDLGGAAVSRTTTTDATGAYSFGSLPPGTYTVTEPTQPGGTLNGTTVAGSAGGTPTAVSTTPSAVSGIVVGVGQTASANNFGELPTASISGHVISDSNDNGKLDAGETGIANVTIVLGGTDDLGNAVSATTTSDAGGAYTFGTLRPGNYTVTEPTQPPGTVNGITTAGTVNGSTSGTATPTTTTPSAVAGIVLPSGGASTGNDFAEVGNSPDLLVSKAAVDARFTVDNVGTYTVRVRNGGELATSGAYRVSDRLPTGFTLDATPTGTDWSCVGAAGATTFTCTSNDVLAANTANANAITARVRVAALAAQNSPAINAVMVDGGGELPARGPTPADLDAFANAPGNLPLCVAAIAANACHTATPVQASASISGTVWSDVGSTRDVLDGGDQRLAGWVVEVVDGNGNVVAQTTTAADGSYRIGALLPGVALHVRFRDPASNVVWGYPVNGETSPGSSGASCNTAQAIAHGTASSCPGTGADPTLTVVLAAGQNLPQQSLPVDPSGVIYDSGTRAPVPGSVVTLAPVGSCAGFNPATGLVAATLGGYTVNGGAVSMTVGPQGFYQFLFTPAAPSSCTFSITVTPPSGYTFVSTLIPPATGAFVAPGGPGTSAAVQPQAGAPTGAIGPATIYYLTITAGSGTANVIHDHIPLDPAAPTGLSLSKTGDKQLVEIGDSVRYTITVQRSSGPVPRQVTVVDRLPRGLTFIAGTAVVNGVSVTDPAGKPGPVLTFELGAMPATGQLVLQYRVRVGVGAQQGDGMNRAIGYGCGVPAGCTASDGSTPLPSASATNEGRYQVHISGGVFTTDACFAGKIFVDCNGNHIQDPEEIGIPGVRLVVSDGTTLISDSEGKYSYCGLAPRSTVIRVDETTLPRGSRLTTSSNRNLGDAGSLWLDLKNGELARADFIEGSCSAPVLDQVKARRAQGEIRAVETEKTSLPALRFDSKDKGPKARTGSPPDVPVADPPASAANGGTR